MRNEKELKLKDDKIEKLKDWKQHMPREGAMARREYIPIKEGTAKH